MDLCLVLNPEDTLDGADNTILNHAHAALIGDDPSGRLADNFKNLAANTKRYMVQSLIRQHCNLTGEEFAIIDLPEDAQKEFVVGLLGKKKATKRSDTPDVVADEKPSGIEYREVKSETDPDTTYRVTVENDKVTKCECVGYRYYQTCKHAERIQKELDNRY